MDLSTISSITIPEGEVVSIASGNVVLWESNGLPSAYQKVEYIQDINTGTAYLNLGFAFDTAATIEFGMYFLSGQTIGQIFGATEDSGKLRCLGTIPVSSGQGSFYGSTGSAYTSIPFSISTGKIDLVVTIKKGIFTVYNAQNNSTTKETTQGEFKMTNNLHLMGQNYNGTNRCAGWRRVYYFRYFDKNNTLICDLVPCYRKADGVIGMYDLVRQQFLTNQAKSGTNFTKGADVA